MAAPHSGTDSPSEDSRGEEGGTIQGSRVLARDSEDVSQHRLAQPKVSNTHSVRVPGEVFCPHCSAPCAKEDYAAMSQYRCRAGHYIKQVNTRPAIHYSSNRKRFDEGMTRKRR